MFVGFVGFFLVCVLMNYFVIGFVVVLFLGDRRCRFLGFKGKLKGDVS